MVISKVKEEKTMSKKIKLVLRLGILGLMGSIFAVNVWAYSIILPNIQPSPPLPYGVEKDHYSGPACAQMTMNAAPGTSCRILMSQDDIYSSIISHNTEPSLWFSDPNGLEWVLENLMPCGNWSIFSNPDRYYVMGKALYYMHSNNYLVPLLITSGEHWVVMRGFTTDITPPFSGTVSLNEVVIYDPYPGPSGATYIINGSTWYSSSDYWKSPINKPGSVWNGNYVAVIEPPEGDIKVEIPPLEVLMGKIFPIEDLFIKVNKWLKERRELLRSIEGLKIERLKQLPPVLVNKRYGGYYIFPFEAQSQQLVILMNAYTGEFQELGIFSEPIRYLSEEEAIRASEDFLISREKRLVKIFNFVAKPPELVFDPSIANTGRYLPLWKVTVPIMVEKEKKKKGKQCLFKPKLPEIQIMEIYTDQRGKVQKYSEGRKYAVYEYKEKVK